jgi:hypothetical protein
LMKSSPITACSQAEPGDSPASRDSSCSKRIQRRHDHERRERRQRDGADASPHAAAGTARSARMAAMASSEAKAMCSGRGSVAPD